jgi:hypothetical protein
LASWIIAVMIDKLSWAVSFLVFESMSLGF